VQKKRQVAWIEWEDSVGDSGWRQPSKEGPSLITTVGYVVHKEKTHITLTTSVASTGNVMDQLTIPTSAIRKIKITKV